MVSAATAPESRPTLRLAVVVRGIFVVFTFGVLPACFVGLFVHQLANGYHSFDFHTFWQSGRDVLDGRSPYATTLPAVAHEQTFRPFVYPAPAAIAMVPVSLIPYAVADALWAVLGLGAIIAALRLLDVRDWRCYGAVLAWPFVWSSLINGAISALVVLACAALWRYRSRPWAAAALVAALVVFKLYFWPLGIWLIATRRWRATFSSIAIATVATLAGYAVTGFSGLRKYPQLLDRLTGLVADQSYSPYAFFRAAGASPGGARLLMLACGAAVLVALVALARRPGGEGDQAAFILALAGSLILTPIVWPHYLAVLCVALALARPRLGVAWVAPMTLWFVVPAWSGGNPLRIAVVLAVSLGLFGWSVWRTTTAGRSPSRWLRPIVALGIK
jgi:hypothetical protein